MNHYQPDASMLAPHQNLNFIPNFDRHLICGPYAVQDPVTSTLGLNNVSWDLNMSGLVPGSLGEATNALFIPFNLHAPQLDCDGMDVGGGPNMGMHGFAPHG